MTLRIVIGPDDIEKLTAGDEAAFRRIYKVYSQDVYRLAFRFLKNTAWSEEIVQDVYLKLWLNRAGLDVSGNIWLYLYVITKNLCINKLRDIRRSAAMFERLMQGIEQVHNHTEEELFAADMERRVKQVIASLPRQQQTVYELSRTQMLSHKEIAKKLGLSTNTVKNHMVQALKTLKTSLRHSDYLHLLSAACWWIID